MGGKKYKSAKTQHIPSPASKSDKRVRNMMKQQKQQRQARRDEIQGTKEQSTSQDQATREEAEVTNPQAQVGQEDQTNAADAFFEGPWTKPR